MKFLKKITSVFLCWFFFLTIQIDALDHQYLLFHGDQNYYASMINEVADTFTPVAGDPLHIGTAVSFYCMNTDTSILETMLNDCLQLSASREIPVFLCLDVEQWLNGRPDIWNWFDPQTPGYDPQNALNVEWFGWSIDDAIKISWRNWGSQIRVLPAPNLMSPEYRAACRYYYEKFIPVIVDWYRQLPEERKYLFAGLKVGWESGIGLNAAYHPNGNYYYETWPDDPGNDPPWPQGVLLPPDYSFQQIGYAALVTAGIKSSGEITEADLAEVTHRHLEGLAGIALELGVPREKPDGHTTVLIPEGCAQPRPTLIQPLTVPIRRARLPGESSRPGSFPQTLPTGTNSFTIPSPQIPGTGWSAFTTGPRSSRTSISWVRQKTLSKFLYTFIIIP
jgi:hypothetical protein